MKKNLILLFVVTGNLCFAGTARLDLVAENAELKIISTSPGVSGKNMGWLPPEKAKQTLYLQQRSLHSDWTTMRFSFIADRDTSVRFIFRGPFPVTQQEKRWPSAIFYDEFYIDGQLAPNGGFEPEKTASRRWKHLVVDSVLAAAGNGILRVTHDDPEAFSLPVKAGKVVHIELLHRDGGSLFSAEENEMLSLKKLANRTFADQVAGDGKGGGTDQGKQSLTEFVPQRFYGGMEFDIPSSGNAVVTMDPLHDRTGIKSFTLTSKTKKAYNYLYLLHAAAWVAVSEEKMGTVTVQYEDGSSNCFSIENGRNICDWWFMMELPYAKAVYMQNREEGQGGILLTRFPLASKSVKSIQFETCGKSVWLVVGATLSNRDITVQGVRKELRYIAPRWKKADMPQLDLIAGSALDLSKRPRFSPEKDGAMLIDQKGGISFRTQKGIPVRLIGFNAFPALFRLKGKDRQEIHRKIDYCLEQAKRMGYDYFRTNFFFDRDLFQGAAADFEFNPEFLDRFDYLVAASRKYDIYIYGTIASYQLGRSAWNNIFNKRTVIKNETLFGVPERRAEWKKLVVKLLTHVNPYTGIAYKDDPVFLCFEFYNELELHVMDLVRSPEKFPAETLEFINSEFIKFLREKYKTSEELAAKWKIPGIDFEKIKFYSLKNQDCFHSDWQHFYVKKAAECLDFFHNVMREIKCDRYVAQYNVIPSINLSRVKAKKTDIISINTYLGHPSKMMEKGSVIRQNSSLSETGSEFFWKAASCRLAGYPLFVTEYNHCYWNQYEYEGGIFFPAYSALQGFSGITIHSAPIVIEKKAMTSFEVGTSPTKRANEFLAMSLFRRGDVQSSPHRVELLFPDDFFRDGNAGAGSVNSNHAMLAFLTGIALRFPEVAIGGTEKPDLSLLPAVSAKINSEAWFSSVENSASGNLVDCIAKLRSAKILSPTNSTDAGKQIFISDTGQLMLDMARKRLKVITPETEVVTLKPNDIGIELRRMTVHSVDANCAAAVTTLDDLPLSESRHMMFVLNTASGSEGLVLSGDRTTLVEWKDDTAPQMETVRIDVSLKITGKNWKLYPLSLSGKRRDPLPVAVQGDSLRFRIDTASLSAGTTPFFELVKEE